jgi:uncharacterized membrane protein YqhA
MLRLILALRYIMLIASIGAGVGAALMFWEGAAEVAGAADAMVMGEDRKTVIAAIMHGTDAFLFGIVLIIFAYAIAFGFVLDRRFASSDQVPAWMRVSSISELKTTLVEVILLYLVVDFATDWPEGQVTISWEMLAKPLSILAIAVAFGVFSALHPRGE